MRISELAEQSGVPVATIKYYLREGLLPSGTTTAATQASYSEAHLARLRLVRVLREVGRVPVAAIRAVLAAVDDPTLGLQEVLGVAHHALAPISAADAPAADRAAARAFVNGRGWRVSPDAPALGALAGAMAAMAKVRGPVPDDVLVGYADIADALAQVEIASLDPGRGVAETVADVAIGTVVYEQVLVSLRRLAQEHYSAERFRPPAPKRRRQARRG